VFAVKKKKSRDVRLYYSEHSRSLSVILNSLKFEGYQMTRTLKDLVAESLVKNSMAAT